jgi:hypothetical protein
MIHTVMHATGYLVRTGDTTVAVDCFLVDRDGTVIPAMIDTSKRKIREIPTGALLRLSDAYADVFRTPQMEHGPHKPSAASQ